MVLRVPARCDMPDPVPQRPDWYRPGEPPRVPAEPPLIEQIIVQGPGKPLAAPAPPTEPAKPQPPKDGFREIVETIVFVVVLVLLLKTFLAEAFVIPTGSMATTLLGYHKECRCEECGWVFPINCSSEVEPQQGQFRETNGGVCPNCYKVNQLKRLPRR